MATTPHTPRSATIPRIAIVGGGPGGILTAWYLERQATRALGVTIFEASGRLGGKVLTPSFTTARVQYEAGAAELYDYTPVGEDPLRDLVAALGLPTMPLGGTTVVTPDGPVANLDDLTRVLGFTARRELEAFDQQARAAMTRREFYAADHGPADDGGTFADMLAGIREPVARRYVETMIHSDLATEPGLTNVGYGLQNYLMNDPAYMRLYCIVGGNERLIEAIVAGLHADIRLEAAVRRIDAAPGGGFTIATAGSPADTLPFDAVVLALPLQHLTRIGSDDDTLAAALAAHCGQFDHPAHYLRVTALFDEPFWQGRIDGGYLMLDAFGGCCLYDESARDPEPRHGVLGWLLGGSAAETWACRDDDAIVAAAIGSLPDWLGDARQHLRETRVHRWIGAVSALPGGWRPPAIDRRHQPAPTTHPRLFVVGDYLFDSTLNGVLDSAQHVAGWLAADFG
jgi:protoporphyrinogen oxidase